MPDLPAPISEGVELALRHYTELVLSTDAFTTVGLGGLTGVNVLIVKAVAAKVVLRLTSTDGSQQTIPVESFAAIISEGTAYTAIDVRRTPGVSTTVRLFLGQRA